MPTQENGYLDERSRLAEQFLFKDGEPLAPELDRYPPKNQSSVPSLPPHYRKTISLGGLRKSRDLRVWYSPSDEQVVRVKGTDVTPEDVELSEKQGFNIPFQVAVEGVELYPTSYEFTHKGEVVYHAPHPPRQIEVPGARTSMHERTKVMEVTLTEDKLEELGKYSERRRKPAQKTVMGETASEHAERLADEGRLVYDEDTVSWQWNHLLAFSMLPRKRAQSEQNLLCGTAAANGQMANIELAARAWVEQKQRPLGIEVRCTHLVDSSLGMRLRYRLYDKRGSGMSHCEYFDLTTIQNSEYSDLEDTYNRMCQTLERQ